MQETTWQCLTCEGQPKFEHEAFWEHLQHVHSFDAKTIKGTRRPTTFMDGPGYAGQVYEWTLKGGLKLLQIVKIEW